MYFGGEKVVKKKYEEGSFGAYLVELLAARKYSQSKFAKDLGVSKTYLFDVFNGRVKPPTPDKQDIGTNETRRIFRLCYARCQRCKDAKR